jgi:hypothetical protein
LIVQQKTPSELCERVIETLPAIAAQRWERVSRWPREEREKAEQQTGNLVILDRRRYALFRAHFRQIFPPPEPPRRYSFTLTPHNDNIGWRFGINQPQQVCIVNQEVLDDPTTWCDSEIFKARAQVEAAGFKGVVGERGACVLQRGRSAHRWTSFNSYADAADQLFPSGRQNLTGKRQGE